MKESKIYPYLKALLEALIEAAPNWAKAPGRFFSSLSEQLKNQKEGGTKTPRKLFVFISCPDDVKREKKIAEEVCRQLTKTLGPSKGIKIIPVQWEKDVVPVITGEGAQAEIDKQIGQNYDIYIGIMWKRFGNKQQNGLTPTEHEFNKALERRKNTGKPVVQFHFKLEPYCPQNEYEKSQIAEVERFKQKIRDLGLYGSFESGEDLRKKLSHHLREIIENPDLFFTKETLVPKRKYLRIEPYLSREVCLKKDYTSSRSLFLRDKFAKDTIDAISDCKRIALIGDAGIGKTIELKRVAWHFSKDDSELYPFLIALNKYVKQSIAELLPPEWGAVPEGRRVVILDGLDEIESKNKNDARRQIELFAEQQPETYLIVSCRTNFYESETQQMSGTLKGFSSYVLLDLGPEEIEQYVSNTLQSRAEDFNEAISNSRLYELLKIPFYLIRLVELFKKNNALPNRKAEIFEQLFIDRIQLDVEHFRTTTELGRKQQIIIKTLQRLALGMEILGRNYIADDEYNQIIEEETLRELIEHCTVWKRDETEATKWQFEHNNFQEYLAAKSLSEKPLSTIKQFMFFEPDYRKLIPSWSNTLSFLISVSNDQDLIHWIMDNEPELVVKFESDRIETNTRIRIFKEIFNHYKEKQIWINHDKFRYDELARLGQSDEIVEYVLCEAERATHYTIASNSINLLSYMQVPDNQKARACNMLVNYALRNDYNSQVQKQALIALADLNLNSLDVINKITKGLRTSKNEWTRYGLYYFLHNSDYLDDNIDVFLNGLQYVKFDLSTTRGRLMDERWHLRIGLEKAKSPHALVKILKHFIERPQDIGDINLEKSISIIAENAADAFSKEHSLFQLAKILFKVLIDGHSDKEAHEFMAFFDKTQTRLQVFGEYLSQEKGDRDCWSILAILADNTCVELFVKEYKEGKLKDKDVLVFRNYLGWKNPDLYSPFNELINAETGNKFPLAPQRDYDRERKERTQRDINLLFDKLAFLKEIKLIFDTENTASLTIQEILDVQSRHWDNPYFSDLAIDQLRHLAKERSVTFEDVVKTVNGWKWDLFCISNIYERLSNNENIVLTNEQKAWVANWCNTNLSRINFKTALETKSERSTSSSYTAIFLWYFLRKFNLVYPKDVLLDLLSYDWIQGGGYIGIEYLEALLSKHEITTRILTNLKEGITNDDVLKNHFNYCKRHKIVEVLPYDLGELTNSSRENDVKSVALDVICELSTTEIADLENVLSRIKDDFKWNVIEKLVQNNSDYCRKYLLLMVQTANEEEKLKSANYLVELQDLEGLKYYVDWVKRHKKAPETTRLDKSPLLNLRTLEAVPYLIELLEISYQPSFKKDDWDHLELHVLDALIAIALESDENYQGVRNAMENFINKNKGKFENINFLNLFIEKLEQKYYLAKSEVRNIGDVIVKLREL